MSPEQFRDALCNYPSGVTLVTMRCGETIHGLTVSAFVSVSPLPPLIAVVIDHRHTAHGLLEQQEAAFAVNILREDQAHLSRRFAWTRDENRFEAGDWGCGVTGAPVLRDAVAWLDCRLWSRQSAGTHTIYVGEVRASATPSAGAPPLVYWNREYGFVGTRSQPDAESLPRRRPPSTRRSDANGACGSGTSSGGEDGESREPEGGRHVHL